MKYILYILCLLLILNQTVFSKKFEFTPINVNFKQIANNNDIIIICGDFGSIFLSEKNAENWQQILVFENGTIIKVIFVENKIFAFNDNGSIAVSIDNGKKWSLIKELNDSVRAVTKFPEGYLIRQKDKLSLLNNNFEEINDFTLESPSLTNAYKYDYLKSIAYFNNQLIAAIDSIRFIRFDTKLNSIDTINFANLTLSDYRWGNYQIDIDSNYFYTKIDYNILKTKDFTTVEIVFDSIDNYKIINNQLYFIKYPKIYQPSHEIFKLELFKAISRDSSIILSEFKYDRFSSSLKPKDFLINDNMFLLVGNGKFIAKKYLNDSSSLVISDFTSGNVFTNPTRLNDSTFLFFNGFYNNTYNLPILITKNKGLTFEAVLNSRLHPEFFNLSKMQFNYFDKLEKKLYLGLFNLLDDRNNGVYISDNLFESYKYKSLSNFNFSSNYFSYPASSVPCLPNISRNNENFVTAYNIFWAYDKINHNYTSFCTYNKDFDVISKYNDSNMVVDYINSLDTNSFLIHCLSTIDTTFEIKYTSNHGIFWDMIKKYKLTDTMIYYRELSFKNSKILFMLYYNALDSMIKIDALDINTRTVKLIYECKTIIRDYLSLYNNGIFSDSTTFYLAMNDTLFYTDDIYNRNKWKNYYFPDNGRIIRTCEIYGNKIYARYKDDIRQDNNYWITINNKPEQLIVADDYDFGKLYVNKHQEKSEKIKLFNPSNDENLIITGYSLLNEYVFTTSLPQIDSINYLMLRPGQSYEFTVSFKPDEIKSYRDSIVFFSNSGTADNVTYLRGEGIDTVASVDDYRIEENYLYSYPPYPLPAHNKVRSLIYWDLNIDIDNDVISVYDIFGGKVCGREKINIEKITPYSGYLNWDCSGIESGVFLIKINHGTRTMTIKAIVSK